MRFIHAAALVTVMAAGASSVPAADFVWPVSGRVSNNYYSRRTYGYHAAIDIAGPTGSAVGASRAGYVRFRGWSGGYGNLVIVRHSAGYDTYYAHNSRFGYGGSVYRLKTISYRGSTGNSTGPHVHFEIRRYGAKKYIPASIGSYKTKGYGIPYNYSGI